MPDFIPPADDSFNLWQSNFLTYATANTAALGLVAGDLTPITSASGGWSAGYSAHLTAQATALGAAATKDSARHAYEVVLRPLIARIQSNPTVTDARRAGLGIPIRAKTKTPVAAPTTRPVAVVDTSERLRHLIKFADETTPNKTAKPKGVLGAEIWVKLGGTAPVDETECTFLALDTATPYLAQYPGAQAGKQAHYLLRWVNTRGEHGPWCEPVSATIVS